MAAVALTKLAAEIRKDVLKLAHSSKSGHIGSSFSATDLMTCLYFDFLKINPSNPEDDTRDRFIMSKGHAAAVYYTCLSRRGFFGNEILQGYGLNGGNLSHHPHRNLQLGIEASTGSLGHGLGLAAGLAFGAKLSKAPWRAITLMSDGELNEGSVWEACCFAAHHNLDNLLAVVDMNQIQGIGFTRDICSMGSLEEAWKALGWGVRRVDGHEISAILRTLNLFPFEPGKPSILFADTVKGKGVSFMEGQMHWHYRCPDQNEYEAAMRELAGKEPTGNA